MKRTASTESENDEATFEHASVQAVTDAGVIIHAPSGVAGAQIAAGCLLTPAPGDRVLVSRSGTERFVLTVLTRQTGEAELSFDGDLRIRARNLALAGREATSVESGHEIGLRAPRVAVTAGAAELATGRLGVTGQAAHVQFRHARVLVTALESIGDRVVQSVRQLVRHVQDTESVQSGNLIQRVRDTYLMRSRRTSLTSRKDTHIDGERIHMG